MSCFVVYGINGLIGSLLSALLVYLCDTYSGCWIGAVTTSIHFSCYPLFIIICADMCSCCRITQIYFSCYPLFTTIRAAVVTLFVSKCTGKVSILLATAVVADFWRRSVVADGILLRGNVTGTVSFYSYLFVFHFIGDAQEYFTFTHNMRVIIPHSRNSKVLSIRSLGGCLLMTTVNAVIPSSGQQKSMC